MNKEKQTGFESEKEVKFLARLDGSRRRVSLEQELVTQLSEDFGLVKFSQKFKFDEAGEIRDLLSGEKMTELTERGGVVEETKSIRKIEAGLRSFPDSVWVHFSPKNEELGYTSDCVDFWRRNNEGMVIWNRLVVKNNLEEMNRIREWLSGEREAMTGRELLANPVKTTGLKLSEIFDLLTIGEIRNEVTKRQIDRVVERYINDFWEEFGDGVTVDKDLIFRLYSICYRTLEGRVGREEIEDFMYGRLLSVKNESSFGCSMTTTVGAFGEKVGYYVLANGEVKRGRIPEGFKECKECGCWYTGDKCPFCH